MFGTIKSVVMAAGSVMLLTAGAAQANEPVVANVTAMTNANTISSPKVKLSQRYCIVDSITGSRIDRKNCATLAEWQVRGVDPRRMPRR